MNSNVYILKCNSYENSKKVINDLIAFFPILSDVKSGTKILIKANLISALSPESSAPTNYILIKYLTEYFLSKKCSVIIGDSPSGKFDKSHLDKVYKITKMTNTNAKLNNDFRTKKASFMEAKVLKTFEYTAYLDDADIKINFAKLKTHAMMGLSLSVKNLFGTIPGTLKAEYHYRYPNHNDFANMLIDINEYFKFDVNIIDGITAMEGNGPTMGKPKNIGLLLASTNPYALDYICSKIVKRNPISVETIKESINRKLFDPNSISLNDDINKYVVSNFENIKNLNSIRFTNNKFLLYFANSLLESKPNALKKECRKCGKCMSVCPKNAITMKKGYPFIDRSKCIKCFCCQELCPFGAMKLKTSVLGKLYHLIYTNKENMLK